MPFNDGLFDLVNTIKNIGPDNLKLDFKINTVPMCEGDMYECEEMPSEPEGIISRRKLILPLLIQKMTIKDILTIQIIQGAIKVR